MAGNQSTDCGIIQSEDYNVDFIEKNGKVVMLRCRFCCKFIKRTSPHWYCPHCEQSFLEDVSTEDQKEIEDILEMCKDYGDY